MAVKTEVLDIKDLAKVIVDTTVQEKAITFPTDAKLMNRRARSWSSRQEARAQAASRVPASGQAGPDWAHRAIPSSGSN